MATSPNLGADGPVRLTLNCAGTDQEGLAIISVQVRRALNALPWARLEIADGDMPEQSSPLSDGELFAPGTEIVIKAGYDEDELPLFTGIVVRHGFKISGSNDARLIVECRDKACKMTLGRNSAHYVDQTDSAVIETLIGNAGLQADVQATTITHKELVQYYCSDWDFMLARADALGLLVDVDAGKVSVKPPDTSAAASLSLDWGTDLIDFAADIDARSQWSSVQAASWDPAQQALSQGSAAAPPSLNAQGDLDGATLAAVASPAAIKLQSCAPQPTAVLDAWAKAVQLKAGLARVQGHASFQGSASAKPGCLIELKGVGKRFDGALFVSAVEHEISDGNWVSMAEFGLAPQWQVERPDLLAAPAGGLLPGVGGLQTGVVLKLDGDPEGENKIQVKLPSLQTATEGIWARLLQFHASSGFGAFFLPEVGDEVVLGYFNDDPCHPVVLGSLYSSKRAPPYALAAENNTKALVTRYKHKIELDEDKKTITITTPSANQLVLDDSGKSILIKDQNGNSIKLSESGIALDSPKDITLTAKGGITLDAVNAISLTSKADVKAAGLNISCEAQVGFSAKGAASAELSASGQTTVKGAMVMIN
ncbi:MAG: Rhs element Vgr protein [Methylibium sp.]|nr:Rhs element Vgr protein [Methylibium sp.]